MNMHKCTTIVIVALAVYTLLIGVVCAENETVSGNTTTTAVVNETNTTATVQTFANSSTALNITTLAPTVAPQPVNVTPGPSTLVPSTVCEPSCRVNLHLVGFLQTPNNVQLAFSAVAEASGVGTVARVAFNSKHPDLYGVPLGNATVITVTISSFPLFVCNNYTNHEACLALVNKSNPPTLAVSLSRVGVTNGTLIPADAVIPTFGLLATVPAFYLALYVGGGLGYLLFLLWSIYKYLIAIQRHLNERARDEAEKIGLTLEELEQRKKNEEEAAKQKLASKRRLSVKRNGPPSSSKVFSEQSFSTADADETVKHSLERIVARMKYRSTDEFQDSERRKRAILEQEMTPVISKRVLDVVNAVTLPPSSESAMFAIKRGGLVDIQDTLATYSLPTSADSEPATTFRRRLPQGDAPQDVSTQPSTSTELSTTPALQKSAFDQAIDELL